MAQPKRDLNLTDDELLAFVDKHKGLTEAALSLGVPRSTLYSRYHKLRPTQPPEGDEDDQIATTVNRDQVDLVASFRQRIPPEEVMRLAGYSPKFWSIVQVKTNQWQVAGKRKDGQDKKGRWKPEKLWKTPLFQISITLRRNAPQFVQEGIDALLADWKNALPKISSPPKRSRLADPHLLEISLVDAHFGKLCWGAETGDRYDLGTADDIYLAAVNDLIDRAGAYKIERIIFPVGQDFFNVDNWQGTTEHGTLVDSTDDRFTKVFTVGCDAIRRALLRCREIAPTRVIWSPGNHDRATSWYLCKALSEYFKGVGATDVEFDLSPKQRKYELYGNQLLAWTHGCDEKPADLPLIMAKEEPVLWGKSRFQAWHMGHFHKRKETRYTAGDTFNGVSVAILPSLSGTDAWHSRKGYSTPQRAAEAYLWSRDRGISSVLIHNV